MIHTFESDLDFSHLETEFLALCYKEFFPGHAAVIRHSEDGDHQRLGIDSTVVMQNSKTYFVDEKIRRRVFGDIALEEWSDKGRRVPGWICKPILSDYILYAVPPGGWAVLLPVLQLQTAWTRNREAWKATRAPIIARNRDPATGRTWESVSWGIHPDELFPKIGANLRATLTTEETSTL